MKIILPVVLAASLLLFAARLIQHRSGRASPAAPGPIASETGGSAVSTGADSRISSSKASAEAVPSNTNPLPADQTPNAEDTHQEYVEKRIAELQESLARKDADSLTIILSELSNPDHQIRAAALEATIQFDSLDAIPSLEDAALHTDNPAEKAEFLDAIEFLRLPTATELAQQRRERGETVPPRAGSQQQPPVTDTIRRGRAAPLQQPAPVQPNL